MTYAPLASPHPAGSAGRPEKAGGTVMPYLVLLDLDKIWQPYFVQIKYGSHILSSWTKSGCNIWSPLAISCPPIIFHPDNYS